jgi:hypothetical protein
MGGHGIPRQKLTRRSLLRFAGAAAGLCLTERSAAEPLAVSAGNKVVLTPPTAAIPSSFFGMHIHRATDGTPWPTVPFKTWQLWDADVMWPNLEPRRGVFTWDRLDALVALAEQHNVEPVLVLGLTPTWASARPEQVSDYGPGTSPAEPADLRDWTNYITAVATRYHGRIRAYEIWNEPNAQYFSGDVMGIFRLTQAGHDALKRVDATIKVISPSFMNDPDYLNYFLGDGGAEYIDIVGYHFYTSPGPPEEAVASVSRVKKVMADRGIAKMPIWNTEIGWQSDNFADDDQRMGYVARTALLNWALGIDRFGWYAWDNHDWCTLWMTQRDDKTLAPGGVAFGTIQQWLIGAQMTSLVQDSADVWTCTLIQPNGRTGRIVWNADRTASYAIPRTWDVARVRYLSGYVQPVMSGAQIMIGASPVLLESAPLDRIGYPR